MLTGYQAQMARNITVLAFALVATAFGVPSSALSAVVRPVLDHAQVLAPSDYSESKRVNEYPNPDESDEYGESYSAGRSVANERWENQGRPSLGARYDVFKEGRGYPTRWSQLGRAVEGATDSEAEDDTEAEEKAVNLKDGVRRGELSGLGWRSGDEVAGEKISDTDETPARTTNSGSSDSNGKEPDKPFSPTNSSSSSGGIEGGGERIEPGGEGREEGSGGGGNAEYDYEYDMEESLATFNWAELVPALVVYSLTFVAGVTGNFLIIMATTSCCKGSSSGGRGFESRYGVASAAGRLHTPSPTNVFLASLASADLLLILICIPVKMAKLFSFTWTMGVFLCKFVHYMQNVSAICSVLTLTAISLERYYAIVHPMKAKYTCTVGQATKIVLGTWAASFLLAIPILFAQVHMSVGERIRAFWCVRDWENVELWQFHELYMLLLILVLPTCVMAGAYASICWEIWKVMRRRYTMTCGRKGINPPMADPLGNGSEFTRGENIRLAKTNHARRVHGQRRMNQETSEMESGTVRKVIKMLVAVVVLFVICWAPILIDNVLTAYGVLPNIRQSTSPLKHMATAFHLMAYFNSCINPIVYGFMSKSFRISFYKVLCRCCYKGRWRSSHPKRNLSTTSQTRTTSVRYTDTSSGRSMSMTTA